MQATPDRTPPHHDLVLIGGGHTHAGLLRRLIMRPLPGLRITLISRDIHTPYSGMLPGLIAGNYRLDDCHIDLRPLCELAGARLIHAEVDSVDLEQRRVLLPGRPPLRFDWLSINTGSRPALDSIPGAVEHGIAVKPIDVFLARWQALQTELTEARLNATRPRDSDDSRACPHRLAIVGGGAASVEIALALDYRLRRTPGLRSGVALQLLSAENRLLPDHNRRVARHFSKQLRERDIDLCLNSRVSSAHRDGLTLANGARVACDTVIWAIHAGSQPWYRQAGLACDARGFIRVDASLQSVSHPGVFAVGDAASFAPALPKSGVYAVRQTAVLDANIRRLVAGRPLKAYRPQRRTLSLLIRGDRSAVASRGPWFAAGAWVWRWKNRIDRRFMARFDRDLPRPAAPPVSPEPAAPAMRCGGCAAKVGSAVLGRVLAQLQPLVRADVPVGLHAPDDAAVIQPPPGKLWVQTVDYFRAFIDDPYLLGRIATNHCLSDIYAMGAEPHSALAIATLPYGAEALVEDTLLQLLGGAVDALNAQGAALIGGHSSEGAELSFGLSVNGVADAVLTKRAVAAGQVLVLTKPLGTGCLFAANMAGHARGEWIDTALAMMLQDNAAAARILRQHNAGALTDVTGFGLLGHLAEMLKDSGLRAELQLAALPALPGALDLLQQGWVSSLHADNQRQARRIAEDFDPAAPRCRLLLDPQTSGGLLASLPADSADACVAALRQAGYGDATIIGTIAAADTDTSAAPSQRDAIRLCH